MTDMLRTPYDGNHTSYHEAHGYVILMYPAGRYETRYNWAAHVCKPGHRMAYWQGGARVTAWTKEEALELAQQAALELKGGA